MRWWWLFCHPTALAVKNYRQGRRPPSCCSGCRPSCTAVGDVVVAVGTTPNYCRSPPLMSIAVACHSEWLHRCFCRSAHQVWRGCCWNCRRSFWPFPPLETLLLSPENFAVDPPEHLAAAGAVSGPVRNRSCFVLKFRADYAAANMCGAVP
ncbi:uncharacterized protein [Arachis hypogaea]|uniref:uncharacterized protein n=1 Tax=Arachis hypogaea TaxID=3818 RepID=UPI000DEC1019|nr:uncharacterized protein LOC112790877 [Arachis hypogaea]XP_025689264.1 uncharacterized protein LOC112790877 [Arachis hypogaea]QHO58089.1 uncharacterized protein DS421_3g87790 [Arachis hypogaea]